MEGVGIVLRWWERGEVDEVIESVWGMVVMGGDDKNKNNKVGIGMRGFFGEIFRADQFGQKGP